MAVKIRLARHGAKKRPFYRVVVADGRMPRDGRYIELVGRYNPVAQPKMIDLDLERIDAWMAKGAQPTNAVSHLIAIARGEKLSSELILLFQDRHVRAGTAGRNRRGHSGSPAADYDHIFLLIIYHLKTLTRPSFTSS